MKIFDKSHVSSRKRTKEGFLLVGAKVGRPGIQTYLKDMDPGFTDANLPAKFQGKPAGTKINVFRPPAEVFNPISMASFEGKPITNNHPMNTFVDASNVKRLQVGFSKMITKSANGDAIEASLVVQDKLTIKEIESGKEEISLGYDANMQWVDGVDDEYGQYDGMMTNIDGNHIAIVDKARAGSDFRLNDNQKTLEKKTMKTRVIDGKSIQLEDDAAQIFDGLVTSKATAETEVEKLTIEVTDSSKEVEKLKGELDAAKSTSITDADISQKINDGVESKMLLLGKASKIVDSAKLVGKSDKDIKLIVIDSLSKGKIKATDASDERIDATYEALLAVAENSKSTAIADSFTKVEDGSTGDVAGDAREKMKNSRGFKQE